jgi:hypothetical protein
MEIVNFGHFKPTSTTGIMFFANEEGQDWYDLRRSLTTWDERGNFLTAIYGAWAVVDPVSHKVQNVEYDPSRIVPMDKIVLGIDADVDDIAEGMLFSNGEIIPAPAPTAEERRAALPNISARQLWLMALDIGITKASILASLETMEDRTEAERLHIELTEPPLNGYERLSPAVETFREMQGIPEEQFDDLWAWASEIK